MRIKLNFIMLLATTVILVACNPNVQMQTEQSIYGTWAFCDDTSRNVSLTFKEDHQLIYFIGPIGTVAYPGEWIEAQYTVNIDSLNLTFSHPFDTAYSTFFKISNNILMIEKVPYYGGVFECVSLTKNK